MEDTSKQEILEAIGAFAEQVDQKFESIDKRFVNIDQRFESIDQRFDKIDQRFNKIEATMVTKSYLDDKLADVKGDIVTILRKEDQKVNRLVSLMGEKKLLTAAETRDVLSFRPFP
ncbi:MAG: hypothetical protein RDU25_05775 [Patescibacteria group bacterium]|nr:hypothetical protein [Patescibacteria group bacterium]